MSDRLTDAETALAHAEAAIEDLSDEVRRQGAEIEALRRDIRRLEGLIDRLRDDGGTGQAFVP